MFEIPICPTCGSRKIRKVRQDLESEFRGEAYVVPDLEFHECPRCGEKIYDREAMRKIQAVSPAYARQRPERSR